MIETNNILSNRVINLKASATFAMSQKARSMKAQGIDIIDLSVGEPDFKTPNYIQTAAKEAIESGKYFGYPPAAGYKELKEEIVKKFRNENNINCEIDQIIVTNGAKQALSDSFFCLLNPGDEVIIFAPYWVSYTAMVEIAGGKPIIVQGSSSNNYKVTAQQLENAITSKTKAIIYSSPCNPSGSVFTKNELLEISEVLLKHKNIITIADEIYEHINFTGEYFSLGSIDTIEDRVITINGFSKAFAMTGWRLGYLAAPKFIAKTISNLHGQISFGASTISQRAGISALKAGKEKVKYMIDAYKERRNILIDYFNEHLPNIKISKPDGAFYLFPDISFYFGKTDGEQTINNSTELSYYILEKAKVALVSGETFGYKNCIRISFAASKQDLIEAMNRIKDVLLKLK
ncbi:MAG: pyridoxal phosphate-dependent aminotransferase [Bacteroidetes bacterium]|nr:pyridoxal phosphate-dependent aminotransferase [Bacteroidota bacterium]